MEQKKINSSWLIDDDKIYLFGLRKMIQLSKLCCDTTEFNNGGDAIEKIKSFIGSPELLPDIIFLDINMPVMDGWHFLKEYESLKKSLNKKIVIYMVSSSIDERDIARATQEQDVKDYIIKPLSFEKLQSIFLAELQ
jgi:CheY-like chemotaxis protein